MFGHACAAYHGCKLDPDLRHEWLLFELGQQAQRLLAWLEQLENSPAQKSLIMQRLKELLVEMEATVAQARREL